MVALILRPMGRADTRTLAGPWIRCGPYPGARSRRLLRKPWHACSARVDGRSPPEHGPLSGRRSSSPRFTSAGIARVRDALRTIPGVAQVYSRDELTHPSGVEDPIRQQLANGYVPSRSGDFAIVLSWYWLVGVVNNANHGSSYQYDTRVPILLAGPGIVRGEMRRSSRRLDIAPTLAYLMGITLSRAQAFVTSSSTRSQCSPASSAPRRPTQQR